MKKRIAFYSPHLSITGGPVSVYDYADHNEKILGNESIIIYDDNYYQYTHPEVEKKFQNRFSNIQKVMGPEDRNDWHWNAAIVNPKIEEILEKNNCDAIFISKLGVNDGIYFKNFKTLIQCLGTHCQPHGHVYSYCSEWLARFACENKYPNVPFMVTPLPGTNENLRKELGIPEDAIVFGRTGGDGSWATYPNVYWASQVVEEAAKRDKNRYFIFLNTPKFSDLENIKFLPATSDYLKKSIFINTCDAMLHARSEGEGFGLSCGEFAWKNKPIITYGGSKERFHIELIEKYGGYIYNNPNELFNILNSFVKEPEKNWNVYREFNPESVMEIFDRVYLQN